LRNVALAAAQSYVHAVGYGPVTDAPIPTEGEAPPYSGALVAAAVRMWSWMCAWSMARHSCGWRGQKTM
jgi:hypothetical protein